MALTPQQQNWCNDAMTVAEQVLELFDTLNALNARFVNNNFAGIADADLAAYSPTAHLSKAKIQAFIVGLQNLQTDLGAQTTGDYVKFSNMKG
jgi:hypothetical protein